MIEVQEPQPLHFLQSRQVGGGPSRNACICLLVHFSHFFVALFLQGAKFDVRGSSLPFVFTTAL